MELNETIQPTHNEQPSPVRVFSTQEDAVNYILQQSSKGTSVFYIQAEEHSSADPGPEAHCLGQHDYRMMDFIH